MGMLRRVENSSRVGAIHDGIARLEAARNPVRGRAGLAATAKQLGLLLLQPVERCFCADMGTVYWVSCSA